MNYSFSNLHPHTMKVFFISILISFYSIAYGQSALNILDLYHETFADVNARIVEANPQIGDYYYHASIGGISFQAVALPAGQLKNENILLDFADNRLVIRIGTKTFFPGLPYWQLAPIVQFVNSPFSVAFSQSGNSTDKKVARCRFHPAFLDNLLGLRIFQADQLNMADVLWDLPVDAQKQTILATSEQGFLPVMDASLHLTIYNKLSRGEFTSFVLTDKDVKFVFDTDESGIKITGQPYYFFTRSSSDTTNLRRLRNLLIQCYDDIESNAKIILKNEYTPALNPRNNLSGLVEALTKRKEEQLFNPYSVHFLTKALSRLDSINSLTDEQMGMKFQVLNDYSESFKPYWDFLKRFNPLVYSTVENTAQWSAFFRYVKQVNPENWSQFVKKVEAESNSDAPAVKTPTSFELNYFRFFDEKEKSAGNE